MADPLRATVRSLYRNILSRIVSLPVEKRAGALEQLRSGFRANAHISDEPTLAKLVQQGNSKLAFLKMITPTPTGEMGGNTGTFVFRDGKVQDGRAGAVAGARHSSYDATNLDPDMVARHQRLSDRQHFGRRR
ncbi:hypothetical protein T492DRAFT_836671 [Pavlovales sp. CCMP2436]|nr:hypothetical protein T492DRAFT_836671 [Pavlovales sp. CCMP2436]